MQPPVSTSVVPVDDDAPGSVVLAVPVVSAAPVLGSPDEVPAPGVSVESAHAIANTNTSGSFADLPTTRPR